MWLLPKHPRADRDGGRGGGGAVLEGKRVGIRSGGQRWLGEMEAGSEEHGVEMLAAAGVPA